MSSVIHDGQTLDRTAFGTFVRSSIRALNEIAKARGQTLAQMALAWVLRDPRVTSTLIGASSSQQIRENVAALENLRFSAQELAAIDAQAQDGHVDLWNVSSRH
eukprot:gene20488-21127_t